MSATLSTSSLAFGRSAKFYDEIYAGRDYDRDIRHVMAFRPDGPHGRLIDWGAGTGEHVARWSADGWDAIGFDHSLAMVHLAHQKGRHVSLGDIRLHGTPSSSLTAHVQTCIFAAFSYATAGHPGDLPTALKNVHNWSAPGGLFVFDVVNHSAAACHLRPCDDFHSPRLMRTLRKSFDLQTSLLTCKAIYTPFDPTIGGPLESFNETHVMRVFTPREITDHLNSAGFDVLRIFDPESPKRAPARPDSFYFMVAARARK